MKRVLREPCWAGRASRVRAAPPAARPADRSRSRSWSSWPRSWASLRPAATLA